MKRIQQNISEERLRMALTHRSFLYQNEVVSNVDDKDHYTVTGVSEFKSAEEIYQSNDRLAVLGKDTNTENNVGKPVRRVIDYLVVYLKHSYAIIYKLYLAIKSHFAN